MEEFITRLENDRLSHGGMRRTYAAWSRRDIKVCLRKFYKWLLGNNTTYPAFVSWIDTSITKEAPPSFSIEEIRTCIDRCRSTRDKALCWTIFETGTRAEEFLNIRISHATDKRSHFSVWVEYPPGRREKRPILQWFLEVYATKVCNNGNEEVYYLIRASEPNVTLFHVGGRRGLPRKA